MTISKVSMSRQMRRTAVAAALMLLALWRPTVAAEVRHVVQPGENPWSISARYLRSMDLWPRLLRHNRIADSQRIAPGTVLRIPVGWLARRSKPARVLAVEGEVDMTDARGRRTRLKTGDSLARGAVLKTGAQDSLSLGFLDDSRVLIKSNSEVRLESSFEVARDKTRNVLIELRHGALENEVVKRSSSGGRFEIRTPAGIAAVRGTSFRVAASEAKTSTEVLAGAVKLRNRAGAVEVAAGFGTAIVAGAAPQAPHALLPAPDLAGLPLRIERVPADLPIPELAGAGAYRTQIAAEESFVTLLFDQTAPEPIARVRDLPDGDYQLRVRAVDADGFEGFDARHRLTIDVRPEPPFLISPADEAKIGVARPSFKWTRREGALTYRFQLARDKGFADLLLDQKEVAADALLVTDDLPPGVYFWRVAAIDPAEGPGPFSVGQSLRRLPELPAIEVASKDGRPAIRWRPTGPDERFQFQIASGEDFASPAVDMTLAKPEADLPKLEPGRYHVRARTIAGDGYVGDWGPTQQFEIERGLSPALLLLLIPLLLHL